MEQTQTTEAVNKALGLSIIKNSVVVELSRSELMTVITEAMKDESANASIKRAIAPILSGAFENLKDYTQVSVGNTDPSTGITTVVLKVPQVKKPKEVVEEEVPQPTV